MLHTRESKRASTITTSTTATKTTVGAVGAARRGWVNALGIAVLAVSVNLTIALGGVGASPAAASSETRWSGLRAASAPGGWVGAYRHGGNVVYRIDRRSGRSATLVRRAAWVLSSYGSYRNGPQAAAVDLALDHLLVGGGRSLSSTRTKQILAQIDRSAGAGIGSQVGSLARTMVTRSASQAGPYRLSASLPWTTPTGQAAAVAVSIRSQSGGAVERPIRVNLGSASATARTSASTGRASTRVTTPGRGGYHRLRITAGSVPEHRLQMKGTRLAIAGARRPLTGVRTIAVQATPTVAVSGTAAGTAWRRAPGAITIGGGAESKTPRAVQATLYGPFRPGDTVSCDSQRVAGTARGSVKGASGRISVPGVAFDGYGTYVWQVRVGSDRVNAPVTSCGGRSIAKAVPTVAIKRGAARVRVGSSAQATLQISGLPSSYQGRATVRLFGPFAERDRMSCTGSRVAGRHQVNARSGSVRVPAIGVNRVGYYTWQAVLPGDGYTHARSTPCGGSAIQVVR